MYNIWCTYASTIFIFLKTTCTIPIQSIFTITYGTKIKIFYKNIYLFLFIQIQYCFVIFVNLNLTCNLSLNLFLHKHHTNRHLYYIVEQAKVNKKLLFGNLIHKNCYSLDL